MERSQRKVYAFHEKFNLARPDSPTLDLVQGKEITSIEEEVQELKDALAAGDIIEVIDALVDLQYFILGTAVIIGVDLEPFFAEVHSNNMSKLNADGIPEYHPNGKVKKPANYVPVDLKSLFDRMYK